MKSQSLLKTFSAVHTVRRAAPKLRDRSKDYDGLHRSSKTGARIIFIEKRRSFPASLRRRQAKVPDSCSHERKALWRPPDIERETRDAGGSPPTRSLSRTSNVFLTKMNACAGNALLKQPVRTASSTRRAGKLSIDPDSHPSPSSRDYSRTPLCACISRLKSRILRDEE